VEDRGQYEAIAMTITGPKKIAYDPAKFYFATGCEHGGIPEPWKYKTVIRKPFGRAALAAALGLILNH